MVLNITKNPRNNAHSHFFHIYGQCHIFRELKDIRTKNRQLIVCVPGFKQSSVHTDSIPSSWQYRWELTSALELIRRSLRAYHTAHHGYEYQEGAWDITHRHSSRIFGTSGSGNMHIRETAGEGGAAIIHRPSQRVGMVDSLVLSDIMASSTKCLSNFKLKSWTISTEKGTRFS